jgi:hypothetical protein
MKLQNYLIIGCVTAMLLLVGCSSGGGVDPAFAKCLTDNGAKMFGAYWCPHCKEQKAEFGAAWDEINYIECSLPGGKGQTEVCEKAGIQGYPTWEFVDGSRQSGRLPLATLAAKSGCPLPVE